MSTPSLIGPTDIPNPTTHAIICLHGFGANGHDFIGLAASLRAALNCPGLAVLCPHGPSPVPSSLPAEAHAPTEARQWFSDKGWTFKDPIGLSIATHAIQTYLTSTVHPLTPHVAILGFSQGGMTLLHALPSLHPSPSGAISVCGALTVPSNAPTPASALPPSTPILFVHGQDDDVLPADASVQAQQWFTAKGYPTQLQLIPNLGHGLDAQALAHIVVFLQRIWHL